MAAGGLGRATSAEAASRVSSGAADNPSATPSGTRARIEDFYGDIDVTALRRELEAARESESVDLSLLLKLATIRTPQIEVDAELRGLAHELYAPLMKIWEGTNEDVRAMINAPHAVVLLNRGEAPILRIRLSPFGSPDFDWSPARALLTRIDSVGEHARVWLDREACVPHLQRLAGAATQVLAAVQRERWRRIEQELPGSGPPTEAFTAELASIEPQIEQAERLFTLSAEQRAQGIYVNAMLLWGATTVAASAAGGGFLLYAFDLSATIGIAFPAGALGAVVSVLQRLTTEKMEIDYQAPESRLKLFGAVRPWIGAVFGMVLYALLQSQALGVDVDLPDGAGPELAYFGVLGFFAGFNERFAKDIVSSSANRLSTTFSATGAGAAR